MSKLKVSVIIPSYNCEQYLRQCLDSVVNQTLADIEIIVVDDCSNDGSSDILHEYSISDNRIHTILNKENMGVSSARNTGIGKGIGKYIIFLDADDYWLDSGMLESLYGLAEYNMADIVSFRLRYTNNNGDIRETAVEVPGAVDLLTDKKWGIQFSPVTKLISKKTIDQNMIRFDPGLIMGEDALFCCELYCYASRLAVSDRVYYNYRKNLNSANNVAWSSQKLFSTVRWFEKAIEVIKSSPAHTRRPDLLQSVITERLRMLTHKLIAMAVEILDDDEFRQYISAWARCLQHIDRGYFDTQIFPNGWPDPPRVVLALVMEGNLSRIRELYKKRAMARS